VRWLEDFRDDTERRVREGLDAAATRNDDLALRRVWSRLADMMPGPRQRVRWSFVLASTALVGGVTAALLLGPLMLGAADRWPTSISLGTSDSPPAVPPLPAFRWPAPPPAADVLPDRDPTPLVVGPVVVRTGARQNRTVRLKSGARVSLAARTTLLVDAGQRPVLQRGRAGLEVPKQPPNESFSVDVGPYVVVVVGTKFNLAVSSRKVEVDVREGLVEVWRGGHRIRLPAGSSWKGPVRGSVRKRHRQARVSSPPETALAPAPSAAPDAYQEGRAALARNDTVMGLSLLRQAADGHGPWVENAGFEIGRVLLYQMYQPRQAIAAWMRYRARFPDGVLRHEADELIVETLLALGDKAAARVEVEAFLRRHPGSERTGRMKKIAAWLAGPVAGNGQPGPPPAAQAN
jgi:hypothetical protein